MSNLNCVDKSGPFAGYNNPERQTAARIRDAGGTIAEQVAAADGYRVAVGLARLASAIAEAATGDSEYGHTHSDECMYMGCTEWPDAAQILGHDE